MFLFTYYNNILGDAFFINSVSTAQTKFDKKRLKQ